jgi:hypothetical protein
MRRLMQLGSGGALFVLMALLGSLGLWVGVPLLWVYIAAQLQHLTGSGGAGLAIGLVGFALTIGLVFQVLEWMSRTIGGLREARGLPSRGPVPLESVLVVSAGLALLAFLVWFFLLSGAQPIPVGVRLSRAA